MRNNYKKALASILCAATIIGGAIPVHAAENVISSESVTKAGEVAVTATVASILKVKLPMAIELKKTKDSSEYGPVFASPENTTSVLISLGFC